MSLRNIRDDNDHHVKSNQSDSSYFLTHEGEPTDKYGAYLSFGDRLEDPAKNPQNLFHELNRLDTKWLKIAKMHLNRAR
jgi:hypothetical protein